MFPSEYKNRSLPRPARLLEPQPEDRLPRDDGDARREGGVAKYEPFAEGWLQGDEIWGRPVYTQQMKDGSLLIADDYAGAIYRVASSAERIKLVAGATVVAAVLAGRPRRLEPPTSKPGAESRAVRGLSRRRRQRDDSRHAVDRRPAVVLHALAAHQVPRRPAQGSADVADGRQSHRHRYGDWPRSTPPSARHRARPRPSRRRWRRPRARSTAPLRLVPPPRLVGHEQIPRLAGQDLAYLVKLLRGFKAQTAAISTAR
jgi:hypothetical protein